MLSELWRLHSLLRMCLDSALEQMICVLTWGLRETNWESIVNWCCMQESEHHMLQEVRSDLWMTESEIVYLAARVAAFDTPWVDIKNLDGLKRFVASSKAIGFSGAHAIHPVRVNFVWWFCWFKFSSQKTHVEAINSGYGPSPAQSEKACRIVEAFVQAGGDGRGSLMVDGLMVDVPVLRAALVTLQQTRGAESLLAKAGSLIEMLDE